MSIHILNGDSIWHQFPHQIAGDKHVMRECLMDGPVTELDQLAQLWPAFCNQENQGLVTLTHKLESTYPFLMPAVQAHLDRQETPASPGRPIQTLREIMRENPSATFGEVFRLFSKKEAIYGFGDLQGQRLLQSMDRIKTD